MCVAFVVFVCVSISHPPHSCDLCGQCHQGGKMLGVTDIVSMVMANRIAFLRARAVII